MKKLIQPPLLPCDLIEAGDVSLNQNYRASLTVYAEAQDMSKGPLVPQEGCLYSI